MGKSRKKNSIGSVTTAKSEKAFKKAEHSRERSAVRNALRNDMDLPSEREFGDPAAGPKDGKLFQPGNDRVRRK